MLTINKTCASLQACNIQNDQRPNSPKLQTLTRDTISFKANEALFLKHLREFCKEPGKWYIAEKAMAYAHSVNPNHPEVVAEFKKIAKDTTLDEGIKEWILEDLTKMVGISGNKPINPK
ncbi:MAG: hypothetical protein PHC34_02905 [Candidatus Gastranaerophilales bacterium]|nr:hypothetical protein [Candidatus Gastranaerophilales bacterium]